MTAERAVRGVFQRHEAVPKQGRQPAAHGEVSCALTEPVLLTVHGQVPAAQCGRPAAHLTVAHALQVYLIIKDVCPGEDERIIITSSLMKDMNSKTDLYRSNAIRVLCNICGQDTQLLVQIERYLKQAIVDKVTPLTACHLWKLTLLMYAENQSQALPQSVQLHSTWRHGAQDSILDKIGDKRGALKRLHATCRASWWPRRCWCRRSTCCTTTQRS